MGKSSAKNPMVNHPMGNPGNPNPRSVAPRDAINDWHDPYLVDGHPPDGTVCSQCGAVYHNQHWNWDDRRRDTLVAAGTTNTIVCPACRKIQGQDPHGIVTLSGDYWPQHREEILNLIRNEEARGTSTNPLERIMDIREEDGSLIIETTNEKLAQKIGRAVHGAHNGDLEYQWPENNRLARVNWQRSLEAK